MKLLRPGSPIISRVPQKLAVFLLLVYRWTLSPLKNAVLGSSGCCRFSPTCSQYALDAVRRLGVARGGVLSLKRICRCHPWGGCGEDPVPANGLSEPILQPEPSPSAALVRSSGLS